ncbi:N-formylmethionyl-tRNA deformylase [Clostridium putrefaciens]|uniref:Peptide deformylase n=2 Tax=Clostridium putrefaciens TaxID=99675 RepID=A0A381J859_9CLOT|nr:peptide deformylase [Clostridium putrefaciens]SUY47305.1 N-formylmethionyl-tRNA deformylase [Clostridium putrefaciens]
MALRNIRTYKDPILRKKSKPVEVVNDRIKVLIKDMFQTMYYEDGVGLAAPQVGILKRVVVVDIGDGPIALINPEIISKEGLYVDTEGCLSLPEEQGDVERPKRIKVSALNEEGKKINFEAEDLFARAICHEVDHLDGILFIDKVIPEGE